MLILRCKLFAGPDHFLRRVYLVHDIGQENITDGIANKKHLFTVKYDLLITQKLPIVHHTKLAVALGNKS